MSAPVEATTALGRPPDVLPVRRGGGARSRWWRRGAIIVVAALVIGVTAQRFVAASHDLDRTRHQIAESGTRLAKLRVDVSAAGVAQRAAHRAADLAVAALRVQRAEHRNANRNLAVAEQQLAAVTRELTASLRIQQRQNEQVAALQRCLDGVSQALNRVGVGDVAGWQAALAAVDPDCRRAEQPA